MVPCSTWTTMSTFQSPMWWGSEGNETYWLKSPERKKLFQSPMWWGSEGNAKSVRSSSGFRKCVSIPDVVGK